MKRKLILFFVLAISLNSFSELTMQDISRRFQVATYSDKEIKTRQLSMVDTNTIVLKVDLASKYAMDVKLKNTLLQNKFSTNGDVKTMYFGPNRMIQSSDFLAIYGNYSNVLSFKYPFRHVAIGFDLDCNSDKDLDIGATATFIIDFVRKNEKINPWVKFF